MTQQTLQFKHLWALDWPDSKSSKKVAECTTLTSRPLGPPSKATAIAARGAHGKRSEATHLGALLWWARSPHALSQVEGPIKGCDVLVTVPSATDAGSFSLLPSHLIHWLLNFKQKSKKLLWKIINAAFNVYMNNLAFFVCVCAFPSRWVNGFCWSLHLVCNHTWVSCSPTMNINARRCGAFPFQLLHLCGSLCTVDIPLLQIYTSQKQSLGCPSTPGHNGGAIHRLRQRVMETSLHWPTVPLGEILQGHVSLTQWKMVAFRPQ